MANSVPFEVERSHLEIGNRRGYSYRFIFEGDGPEGNATVLFDPVKYYDDSNTIMSERFRELGLQPDQTVAHLNEFYPNGMGIPDTSPLMGHGVGTAALELIVSDAKERGARVMHVFSTGRPGMVTFMEKRGFEVYSPKPRKDGTYPKKYRLASKLL